MNKPLRIGIWAFGGTIVGNLIMLLMYNQPSARFFTGEWWQNWTAVYTVWLIFIVIGVVRTMIARPNGGQ